MKELRSTSADGLSVVTIEFDTDVDADSKYDQVLREVNGLRSSLPSAMQRQEVKRNENSDLAVLQLALVSPAVPYAQLDDIAKRIATLTAQQIRVLMMLKEGLLNKQIAHALNVSEATVKAHVSAILLKLGVASRTQAVIAASKLEGL